MFFVVLDIRFGHLHRVTDSRLSVSSIQAFRSRVTSSFSAL